MSVRVVDRRDNARKKQKQYFERQRSEPRIEWDRQSIITVFFKWRLNHDDFPKVSELKGKNRPAGFPCNTTIEKYIGYKEACAIAESTYQDYMEFQAANKAPAVT